MSLITIADATQGFSTFKPGKNMIQPGTTFSLAVRQNLVSSSVNLSSQDLAGMGKSEEPGKNADKMQISLVSLSSEELAESSDKMQISFLGKHTSDYITVFAVWIHTCALTPLESTWHILTLLWRHISKQGGRNTHWTNINSNQPIM